MQFSAAQRLKSRQAVIQKHFADMLAGMSRLERMDMFVCFVHAAILSILCLFLVLVPVPNVENTPSILEVDFFHLLVSVFFTGIIKIKDVILYLYV